MSIKKGEETAQQKRVVEAQRQRILNAFKERKIKDEIGQLTAEKLFGPITKRLTSEESEELKDSLEFPNYDYGIPDAEGPDYGIPEEDLLKDSEEDLLQEADSSFSFPSSSISFSLSIFCSFGISFTFASSFSSS